MDQHLVHVIAEIIHLAISAVGAFIVIWGTIGAVISFTAVKLSKKRDRLVLHTDEIRERLGAHLLLSLEIFIGADIVVSVVTPTWETVGLLAAIVVIRTVLSYFLTMEVEHTRQAQKLRAQTAEPQAHT